MIHNSFRILFFLWLPQCISAQTWDWAKNFGGNGGESGISVAINEQGTCWTYGIFETPITINDSTFESRGSKDVVLIKTDSEGNTTWATRAGSTSADQAGQIAIDANDNVFTSGKYWEEADFQDISTSPNQGSLSALFLAKYNSLGEILWVKNIEGDGVKEVEDVKIDASGNVYLTGYFETSLYVEDTVLIPSSSPSVFVIKLSNNGDLIWARNTGTTGQVKAAGLGVDDFGNVYVGGNFRGVIDFAETNIATLTDDFDAFLLKYNANGDEEWLRQAGGVFDANMTAVAVAPDGATYLTGHYNGILDFDGFELMTLGLNDNIFLAKYNTGGSVLWAKSFGATNLDKAETISENGGKIVIGGYFQTETVFENMTLSTDDAFFNGYLAYFDSNGQLNDLEGLGGSGYEFVQDVSLTTDGGLAVVGHFEQNINFGNISLVPNGFYDIFLAKRSPLPNTTFDFSLSHSLLLSPSPTANFLQISSFPSEVNNLELSIYDLAGRLFVRRNVEVRQGLVKMDVTALPSGIYFIHCPNLNLVLKFVKQ